MNERILDRFTARTESSAPRYIEEGGSPETFGCFGWLRGVRDRALMLELRLGNGNIHCFGYPWLERLTYDPSNGIEMQFGPKLVRILGMNLTAEVRNGVSLLSGITRHRVPWIAASEFAEQANHTLPYVEAIIID